ncbi:hypothetical protein WP12_19880 [Sphingomonas sp. SRS2]|nr:hypothetical protein WP12_19880 [Sphingomonas sp. SRS2]
MGLDANNFQPVRAFNQIILRFRSHLADDSVDNDDLACGTQKAWHIAGEVECLGCSAGVDHRQRHEHNVRHCRRITYLPEGQRHGCLMDIDQVVAERQFLGLNAENFCGALNLTYCWLDQSCLDLRKDDGRDTELHRRGFR